MLFTSAPGLKADESACQHRVAKADHRLHEAVEHHGWDSVPAEHVARHGFPDGIFMRRHAEWWQALLTAYRRRVSRPITTRAADFPCPRRRPR